MRIELKYPNESDRHYKAVKEQIEYLEGVLWSDRVHRMDRDSSRDIGAEIDRYGTGTKAFWRGVIETAGRLKDYRSGEYSYPRIELEGSYSFLIKFVDFLKEEMDREGLGMYWTDADAKLRFAASGGLLRVSGANAKDVVRVLYLGGEVGLESVRHRVDEILTWTPKR
jgi:hypothetical protein